MSLKTAAIRTFESIDLPDPLTAAAIEFLVNQRSRSLAKAGDADRAAFVAAMENLPIADHPEAANQQHYELPPEFFG